MNLWTVSFIGFGLATLAVFVCWCLCRALEAAYQARLALQRDLVSELTARRWSLVWNSSSANWIVFGGTSAIAPGPVDCRKVLEVGTSAARHPRWEIAVQDALKNAKGAA